MFPKTVNLINHKFVDSILFPGSLTKKHQDEDQMPNECDNKRNDLEKVTEDKKRLIKSLPLANVFNHVSRSKQNQKFAAVDDTYINSPQQVVVQLTGHDFTGLGFNICGNMRDGIFVKDVMSRGPANESGKVKAGDKIVSITIACKNMVYEDALTILSYASPYNVELLLEKGNNKENACLNLGQTRKTYLSNNSILGSGRRLLHPLYRSQSLEDLTQIGHSMSEKSFASGNSSPQSVLQKLKSQLINRSAKSDTSERDRTCFSSDLKVAGNCVTINECMSPAKIPQSEMSKVTASGTPPFAGYSPLQSNDNKQTAQNVNIEKDIDIAEVTLELNADKLSEENEHVSQCPPLPAPRRPVSAGKKKGKAPQPPSVTNLVALENLSPVRQDADDVPDGQVCKATVETRAQVHQEDEITSCSIIENSGDYVSNKDGETKFTTKESSQEEKLLNGHVQESEVKTNIQHSPSKVQNNEKPKSSSLGDLTLAHKTNANVLQSVILERAVSLDLKGQHFPEENLCHHFKNIRVPSDVDYKNSENIAFSKWQMKKAETSSIFTTSSSDCMGSNAIISMNGRLGNSECDDSLICIDVSKDNFTSSTPLKKDPCLLENLNDNDSINEKCSDALSEGKIDGKENERTLTEDVCHKQAEKDVIEIDKNELDNVMMSYQ
ncbi:Protein AHNAK2-like protein, partial [Leptotrombidium deliense]